MALKDNKMVIRGYIPFSCKRERLAAWKTLKKEFGENCKVIIDEGFMIYSAKVDRNLYF